MKKTKIALPIMACTLAAALLVGCGGDQVVSHITASSSTSTTTTEQENAVQNLTMLIPDRRLTLGVGTQDGYYYVQPGVSDYLTGQIRYVDYATAMDVPLSTQVNSDHADETDPSYLDSIIGDYRLFIYNEHLYFIRAGASAYVEGSEFGDLATGAVYRMNLDGSERTQVYSGEGSGDLMMYAVGGEDTLYLFEQTVEGIDVLRVPESGGAPETITTLPPDDGSYQLIGCRDGLLYFHVIGYDENKKNSMGDMGSSTHTLVTLDVQTGAQTDLVDLCPDDSRYAEPYMAGSTLMYYYPNGERKVAFCDANGEVQNTVSLTEEASDFQQADNPYVVGNTLFIPCWDDEQKHGYQILVNAETGEVSRSDVCLTQEDGKDPLGATVLAETDTEYLVMSEIRYEDAQMPMGDGTATTVQNQVYGYSLIPKQQFTTQEPAQQRIERM